MLHEQGNALHRSRQKAQPIRACRLGLNGAKEAQVPKQTSLEQAMTHGIRTRDTRTAQIPKLGAVGAGGPSADHPGRPTIPLHQPISGFDVAAPHWP